MEIFNEITCIVLLYHLQLFTNFVTSAETRSMIGASFMTVVLLNISVHLFPMLKESCGALYQKIKAKYFEKKTTQQKITEKVKKYVIKDSKVA